jgi:hypothetical protein
VTNNPTLWYLGCIENNLTSLDIRNGNNTILTAFNSTGNPDLTCIDVDNPAWSDSAWTGIDAWTSFSTDCATGGGEQTYVPDDNFEAYLEANDMGNGIANDDSVTTANINTIDALTIGNNGISDLTGIEDFTLLTSLHVYANQLTSLDVSGLPLLEVLHCASNNITTFDVSNNPYLAILRCQANNITTLDVSNNENIYQLYINENNLTSLDLSQNTSLTDLICRDNQLISLDVRNGNNQNFTGFDATGNPNLTCIDVDDSGWSDANWTGIDTWTSFSTDCTTMPVSEEPIIVTEFKLHEAYPNPFNPTTRISYDLPEDANVSITIYDLMGRKVRTLVSEQVSAGYHSAMWNAKNDLGASVSAGVYIYTISANDYRDVKKMILLK